MEIPRDINVSQKRGEYRGVGVYRYGGEVRGYTAFDGYWRRLGYRRHYRVFMIRDYADAGEALEACAAYARSVAIETSKAQVLDFIYPMVDNAGCGTQTLRLSLYRGRTTHMRKSVGRLHTARLALAALCAERYRLWGTPMPTAEEYDAAITALVQWALEKEKSGYVFNAVRQYNALPELN